jgi:hypothetical protein
MRVALPFSDIKLRLVGPKDSFFASRVQRLDIPTTLPTTVIDEIGNNEHAGTTTDIPEVTATVNLMDVSIQFFSYLTGTDPGCFPASGVCISSIGDVDLVGYVKDADVSDYVKSVVVRRARVTGFTYNYGVDAESTEEYTFAATNKCWFKNDIVVDRFTSADSPQPYTLSQTPIQRKSGDYLVSVIVDGVWLDEVTGAPSTGEYRYNAGAITLGDGNLAGGEICQAVYHANPVGSLWTYISDTSCPPAIRGKDVPVRIGLNSIYRVQSVVIRGAFPSEKIVEMGNDEVVGYVTQVPRVTGDITVLDTDTELLRLLATGTPNPADTEFCVTEFVNTLSLEIRLLDPDDATNTVILKTVYIPRISITSEGHTSAVGGNVSQTFGFESYTAELCVYSGAR